MEKTLTRLFKILVVLGCIFFALIFIFPIVHGIVNPNDDDGLMLGFKITFSLFIIDGSFLAILMPVGNRLLIKTKIDKHPIALCNVDDLLSSLREKLYADGYLFMKEDNSKYGSIWVYKKSRPIHDDYFIVIDSSNISAYDEITDLCEDFGIGDFYYGIFLFCCDGLKKKNVTELVNRSKEGLNRGCLIAVADFQNSTLSFKKITDGFAEKRQHKYIKVLLSFFQP